MMFWDDPSFRDSKLFINTEVFTDEPTLSRISKMLVGSYYTTIETGDESETIRYDRNGSIYDLTYVGGKLYTVKITPSQLFKDEK